MTLDALCSVELVHGEGVVLARQRAREVAEMLGFDRQDQTRIATAVSELARNAHRYAGGGQVRFSRDETQLYIDVVDRGPGIPHLDEVMGGHYKSGTGMGRGLLSVQRLMDDFAIDAPPDVGTHVTARKRIPHLSRAASTAKIRERLSRRASRSPYEEVTQQNQELLLAFNELRARQEELLALNRELDDTNRGVVALYAELDERAESLRDADDRKTRFLADMSHELRSPLNSIVALTELLADDGEALDPEHRKQVGFIRQLAEDQLRLVGDLLDIAKIEAGRIDVELGELSVPELFGVLRAQLKPLVASSAVKLRFDADPALEPLLTDEAKLVQILRNLMTNALKFTREGEVALIARRDGGHVAFTVSDTGVGIAPEDRERVFEEFTQVTGEHQRRVRGTGLGLPLVRKLVAVLGGTIELDSTLGRGSAFTVRLPSRATVPVVEPEEPGEVLIVDDDEAARYVLRTHLRDTGWEVREAASGAEAMAAVATSPPAAILLDLTMPDLDGLEVLRRLRAMPALRDTTVVIHSSRPLGETERRAIKQHHALVLDKATSSRSSVLGALSTREGGARYVR